MTILLTGATGEIGRGVIAQLRARGESLRVLTRGPARQPVEPAVDSAEQPAMDPSFEHVTGDLRDVPSLEAAVAGVDTVVHLAAVTHSRRSALYYEVNEAGTRNLLQAAEQAAVRLFVHVSTRAIGADGGGYADSKLRAEEAVRAASLPWVIVRPAEVYGGGGRDAVLDLVRQLRDKPFIAVLGNGQYRLSPVYIDDVASAVAVAAGTPGLAGRTYTLAGPEEMTFNALLSRIEAFLEQPRPRLRLRVPMGAARLGVAVLNAVGWDGIVSDQIPRLLLDKASDNRDAQRDLGFAPRRLEDGLRASANRASSSSS